MILGLSSICFAANNADEYKTAFRLNHGSGLAVEQVGTKLIQNAVRDLKLTYNFATLGGAISTKLPLFVAAEPGWPQQKASTVSTGGGAQLAPALPKNAIVIGCFIDVTTALTSGGSATVAISTGKTAGDLLSATGYSSFTGIMACTPVLTAASAIKLTADVQPYIAIATAALTAGAFNVHILYVLSDP